MHCGAWWPATVPARMAICPIPAIPQVREAIASKLRRETGLEFTAEDVFMTVGSAGACNVILKSILDPGDEVIVLMPFFPEYQFYITNHSGRMVPVETDDDVPARRGAHRGGHHSAHARHHSQHAQ